MDFTCLKTFSMFEFSNTALFCVVLHLQFAIQCAESSVPNNKSTNFISCLSLCNMLRCVYSAIAWKREWVANMYNAFNDENALFHAKSICYSTYMLLTLWIPSTSYNINLFASSKGAYVFSTPKCTFIITTEVLIFLCDTMSYKMMFLNRLVNEWRRQAYLHKKHVPQIYQIL